MLFLWATSPGSQTYGSRPWSRLHLRGVPGAMPGDFTRSSAILAQSSRAGLAPAGGHCRAARTTPAPYRGQEAGTAARHYYRVGTETAGSNPDAARVAIIPTAFRASLRVDSPAIHSGLCVCAAHHLPS